MSLTEINLSEVGRSIQLAGAIYADATNLYFVLLPAHGLSDSQLTDLSVAADWNGGNSGPDRAFTVALDSEEWTAFLRQSDLVEIEVPVTEPDGKIGRAILRKSERQINQNISWEVFRRDGFRCRYCGDQTSPLTVDHMVTWESGGPSTPNNLLSSCRKCNNTRGEMPFADWLRDPYFKRVSEALAYSEKFALQALVPTLANIPLSPRKGKRQR